MKNTLLIFFSLLMFFVPVHAECINQEIKHNFPTTTDGKTSWVFKSSCTTSELDAVLLEWSLANGYHPHEKKHDGNILWYQRGTGTLTLPIVVRLEPIADNIYTLDAFLFTHPINRNILYNEHMKINSGGYRGVALRAIARKQINPLIEKMNLTPAN
jgi:hypothetical protein